MHLSFVHLHLSPLFFKTEYYFLIDGYFLFFYLTLQRIHFCHLALERKNLWLAKYFLHFLLRYLMLHEISTLNANMHVNKHFWNCEIFLKSTMKVQSLFHEWDLTHLSRESRLETINFEFSFSLSGYRVYRLFGDRTFSRAKRLVYEFEFLLTLRKVKERKSQGGTVSAKITPVDFNYAYNLLRIC